jgi:two-component system response regulator QseB
MPTTNPDDGAAAGATILVVEDDPRIASFLVKGLRIAGYTVIWVTTGADALARLEEGGIDLELLDLGLPDIDGLEVLRQARERGFAVPAIVVTARTDPRDRTSAFDLGVKAYLTKPFPRAELLDAVRAALDQGALLRPEDARKTGSHDSP